MIYSWAERGCLAAHTPLFQSQAYKLEIIGFACSHSTPNISRPYPPAGESFSPPLGGAFRGRANSSLCCLWGN
jgi:hypothetical protein